MDLALAKSPSLDSRVLPDMLDRPCPPPPPPHRVGSGQALWAGVQRPWGGVWRPKAQGIGNILRLTSQEGGPVCGKA